MTDQATRRPEPAWAHGSGLVELSATAPRTSDPSLRSELADTLARYCWGFDERRLDMLTDVFTTDATWSASVMGETTVGPFRGRDAVLSYLSGFWPHQRDQRRHVVTNLVLEHSDTDTARALTYLVLMGSKRATLRVESAGVYQLDYRMVDGQWRISALLAGFDVPFWKGEVADMEPWVRDLFGITAD